MRPMPELQIHQMPIADLVPYANNAKKHPQKQVDEIAQSIADFGNCDPIGVWHNEQGQAEIVEGHGRVLALRKLGIETAPVIFLDHLTDEQRRIYVHVHNQTTLSSEFDYEALVADMDNLNADWNAYGFEEYDFKAGDFGTDFDLPDGEAPAFKTVQLHLTQEQYDLLDTACGQIERDSCVLKGGNKYGDLIAEAVRQWAGL